MAKTATTKPAKAAPKKATKKAAKKAEAPIPTAPAAPDYVRSMAADVLSVNRMEHAGEHGRNRARFKRGELMIELADTAKANDEKVKDLLEEVNAYAIELAENNGVLDFEPINQQEASTTRRVVEAFGSGGDFPLTGAINKLTGEPLVGDDGKPPRIELTEVAVNKLYALASIAPEYLDEAVSFAYRYSEKVVRKAKKVAKDRELPLQEVIAKLNQARVSAPHPATGDVIQVQPENTDAYKLLAEMAGDPPESEVVSIKTTRALYDGFYVPLKKLMSAVASRYSPSLVAATNDGMVSNAFVLEQTIVQFFNIFEDQGVQRALAAMVASEIITAGQADEFVNTFAFDSATDEWKQVRDIEAVAELMGAAEDWEDDPEVMAEVEVEAAAQDDEDWGEEEADDDWDE